MSYKSMADMHDDPALLRRLAACVAQESGQERPYDWLNAMGWKLAITPGWAEAWDSAVSANIAIPGNDPGVITDLMILTRVQQLLTR